MLKEHEAGGNNYPGAYSSGYREAQIGEEVMSSINLHFALQGAGDEVEGGRSEIS